MRSLFLSLLLGIFLSACGGGGSSGTTDKEVTSAPAVKATLVSLALTADSSTYYVDDQFQLISTGTYSDGSKKTEALTYTYNSNELVSYSSSYFKALKAGIVTITGTPSGDNPNKVSANVTIEIKENIITSLQFRGDIYMPGATIPPVEVPQYIFNTGESIRISVYGAYSKNSSTSTPVTDKVSLTSDNGAIATVSTSGTITALGEGKVNITAKSGDIQSTLTLNIVAPFTSPVYTLKCDRSTQIISSSAWNFWRSLDATNLYKWIAFDSASCLASSQWELTPSTTSSLRPLYLVQREGVMYRYTIPVAVTGNKLEVGRNDLILGYTKHSQINFE